MPLERCTSGGKPGYRWGQAGKCYPYAPGNAASRQAARNRALRQGRAIESKGIAKLASGQDEQADIVEPMMLALTAALVRAFGRHFATLWEQTDTRALRNALGRGDAVAALNELGLGERLELSAANPLINRAHQGVVDIGNKLAEILPSGAVRTPVSFDTTGKVVDLARSRRNRLALDLMTNSRLAADITIKTGFARRKNVDRIVRDLSRRLGLTPRGAQAVANFERALAGRDVPRELLSRTLRDRRFDQTLRRAIEGDIVLTPEQIERMAGRYAERLIRRRAQDIAVTEATRSAGMASTALADQLLDEGRFSQVRRFWVTVGDERVRESHTSTPSLNPDGRGPEEMFITGAGNHLRYPGDPSGPASDVTNCRCWTVVGGGL